MVLSQSDPLPLSTPWRNKIPRCKVRFIGILHVGNNSTTLRVRAILLLFQTPHHLPNRYQLTPRKVAHTLSSKLRGDDQGTGQQILRSAPNGAPQEWFMHHSPWCFLCSPPRSGISPLPDKPKALLGLDCFLTGPYTFGISRVLGSKCTGLRSKFPERHTNHGSQIQSLIWPKNKI